MSFKLQYIDHIHQDDNAFSQYGTLAHKLLEEWAKGDLEDFELAAEYENRYDGAVTRYFPPFPKGYAGKVFGQGLAYFESFSGFGEGQEILSAEEKFELDIGGYLFVGIADLVLRDVNTGEITVIDHKTKSGSSMKKSLNTFRKQLYIYAAYVKEKYGVFPSLLRFNMLKEGTFIDEVFDESAYNETMQWVVDTIERIRNETEWNAKPNDYFCNYICGVYNQCQEETENNG